MYKLLIAVAAIAALAVPVIAMRSMDSGLKPGESVTPFHPSHVAGPLAGTKNCFPCTFQARPAVQVWVNGESDENVIAIAKSLQTNIDTHKGAEFKAMIVMVGMSTDCKMCNAHLAKIAEKSGVKDVAFAVIGKDDESISKYKINLDKEVKTTMIAYKDWKVQANMVNVPAGEKGCGMICDTISKLVK
ncbi:MAG: hypothetical protein AB7N10_02395 [Fimbriimonadaceae bacterium]